FVIGEEKSLALLDRTSARDSELVAMKGRNRGVKEVSRIQSFAAQEPVGIPVELVGPRFGNGVDDPAGRPAIFRGIIAGQHRKLLNRVCAQIDAQRAAGCSVGIVVNADAVNTVIILEGLMSGYRQQETEASVAAIGVAGFNSNRRDSRLQCCQLRPI